METMSEENDIDKTAKGQVSAMKINRQFKNGKSGIIAKLTVHKYKTGSTCGGWESIQLKTHKDKIGFP